MGSDPSTRVFLQHPVSRSAPVWKNVTEEVLALRALSTTAIASAVFAHETQGQLVTLSNASEAARISLSKGRIEKVPTELQKVESSARTLVQWGNFTLSRLRKDRRRQQKMAWHSVLGDIMKELEPMLARAQIRVETNFDEISSRAFQSDIESLVVNLVVNAYQALERHQPQGGQPRRLRVTLARSGSESGKEFAQITVADNGPGVPEELRPKIWAPLFSTKRNQNGEATGTGLGLWIVDGTVRDSGGDRSVDSDPELGGSRFTILLPLRREKQ